MGLVDPRAAQLLFFLLGTLAQAALLSWKRTAPKKRRYLPLIPLGLAAILGPIAWLEGHYDTYGLALGVTLIFPWIFIAAYMDEALPRVDERTIVAHTATAWCAAALCLAPDARQLPLMAAALFSAHPLLTGAAALGTVVFGACAVAPVDWGPGGKVFQYCWFLLMVCCLGALQVSFGDLEFFEMSRPAGPGSLLSAFVGGLAVFYLLAHFCFLANLFFLWEDKGKSRRDRKLFEDYAAKLAAHFSGPRCTLAEAALIVAFNVLATGAHYWVKAVPGSFFANGALLLSPILIKWTFADRAPAPQRLKGRHRPPEQWASTAD